MDQYIWELSSYQRPVYGQRDWISCITKIQASDNSKHSAVFGLSSNISHALSVDIYHIENKTPLECSLNKKTKNEKKQHMKSKVD